MSVEMWVILVLFMALVCACSLCGLAASGHCPLERHAAGAGATNTAVLCGSIAVAVVCGAVGFAVAIGSLPWPAVVIGAGLALLAAPLLLRALPDNIVDGKVALGGFAVLAALLVIIILLVC